MRALLVVGVDENDQTLLQKGALYNAFTRPLSLGYDNLRVNDEAAHDAGVSTP